MASFATNSLLTTSQTLSGYESGQVGTSGALLTGVHAITLEGSNPVFIDGTVSSTGTAIFGFGFERPAEVDIFIGHNGSVSGLGDGIYLRATSHINLINHGSISARYDGIDLRAADLGVPIQVINTGTITGGSDGAVIGVHDSMLATIDNSGTISGSSYGIAADAASGDGQIELINSGIISGGSGSYGGSTSNAVADIIRNAGEMIGNVVLGLGNDKYSGQHGLVDGVVYGGSGNDTLHGGEENNHLDGGLDADRVFGHGGNDLLLGGAGDDTVYGGGGHDDIDAGDDNDFVSGGRGEDSIDGGAGTDELRGGQNNDTLNGEAGDDTLYGGTGNDQINGGSRHDIINGNAGDDTLTGGSGRDEFVFDLKAGNDVITDFTAGQDDIDLSAYGIADYAALQASGAISDIGAGTVIDLSAVGGSGSVTLLGVSSVGLGAGDFIF